MHEVVCREELMDRKVGDIIANLGGYYLRGWNLLRKSLILTSQKDGKEEFSQGDCQILRPSNFTFLTMFLIALDAWLV